MAIYAEGSMTNAKTLQSARLQVLRASRFDVMAHAIAHRPEERFHVGRSPLGDHLHLAVRQVPHVTGHGEPPSQALRRVAEADALDPAGIVYTLADDH